MSESAVVRLPQLAWYGDSTLEIDLPPTWNVTVCRSQGADAPGLEAEGFRQAFAQPLGTRTIRELARGRKRVAILFDDACRPTPVATILPYVLEELSRAGIADSDIRFVAALGAHGAMAGVSLRKKLGDDVMGRFLVYNHNPYELCTPLGTTSRGTPVAINTEVMRCDLKIGIGSIMPHLITGFSGGPKIVLPGVASIETIGVNHNKYGGPGRTDIGKYEGNVVKADMDEAARMAGLDVKIDALLNLKREVTSLFVGDVVEEHLQGVAAAKQHYATEYVGDCDIVIANCYFKANGIPPAPRVAGPLLKSAGGDMVLIVVTPEGQWPHYVSRSWGENLGGRTWSPKTGLPRHTSRLTILAPYPDRTGMDYIAPYDRVNWAREWAEVRAMLERTYGRSAKVAVIPDATCQYFPGEPG